MKGGPQPGSGNPGYGKLTQALKEVERLSPTYFGILDEWLNSDDDKKKLEAMRIMSKLVEKTIPQVQKIGGDESGKPLEVKLINYGDSYSVQLPAEGVSTTTA